jgi:hypothetical protein
MGAGPTASVPGPVAMGTPGAPFAPTA